METGDRQGLWGPGTLGREEKSRTQAAVCAQGAGTGQGPDSPQKRNGFSPRALSLLGPSPGSGAKLTHRHTSTDAPEHQHPPCLPILCQSECERIECASPSECTLRPGLSLDSRLGPNDLGSEMEPHFARKGSTRQPPADRGPLPAENRRIRTDSGSSSINRRLCADCPAHLSSFLRRHHRGGIQRRCGHRPPGRPSSLTHPSPAPGARARCSPKHQRQALGAVGFCRGRSWRGRTLRPRGLRPEGPILSGADPPAPTGSAATCPGPRVRGLPKQQASRIYLCVMRFVSRNWLVCCGVSWTSWGSQGGWPAGVSGWGPFPRGPQFCSAGLLLLT